MIDASPGEGGLSPERLGGLSTKRNDVGRRTICTAPVGGADTRALAGCLVGPSAANARPALVHAAMASGTASSRAGRNIGVSCRGEERGEREARRPGAGCRRAAVLSCPRLA